MYKAKKRQYQNQWKESVKDSAAFRFVTETKIS